MYQWIASDAFDPRPIFTPGIDPFGPDFWGKGSLSGIAASAADSDVGAVVRGFSGIDYVEGEAFVIGEGSEAVWAFAGAGMS